MDDCGGIVMQIALGAVYAWSVFRIPLTTTHGWTVSQVTLVFELAIFTLGIAAFLGGRWMKRTGPRVVAVVAGFCYGAGVVLAGIRGGTACPMGLGGARARSSGYGPSTCAI